MFGTQETRPMTPITTFGDGDIAGEIGGGRANFLRTNGTETGPGHAALTVAKTGAEMDASAEMLVLDRAHAPHDGRAVDDL